MQQFLTIITTFTADSEPHQAACPEGFWGRDCLPCLCSPCDRSSGCELWDRTEVPQSDQQSDQDQDQDQASHCSSSPCGPGGTCEEHDGTFTCYCGPGRTGKLCQQTLSRGLNISVPAFTGKSHIRVGGGGEEGGGLRSDLRLEFKTFLGSCLLYHSPGGLRRPGDSLVVSVRERFLQLSLSLSGSSLLLSSESPVSLGAWHSVRVSRYRSHAMLQLDNLPPVTGQTPLSSLSTLDLAQSSYLGHSPSLPLPGLQGCVRSLTLGRQEVSLDSSPSREVTECRAHPCTRACQHGADCVSVRPPHQGRSLCLCPPDYTGNHCQFRRGLCQPNPCHHGGVCSQLQDQTGFSCDCSEEYTGSLCHIKRH